MAAVFLIFQGEPKRHYAVHELIIRLARQGREARNIHTRHPRHFSPCFGNSLDRMPISTASATSRAALGSPAMLAVTLPSPRGQACQGESLAIPIGYLATINVQDNLIRGGLNLRLPF